MRACVYTRISTDPDNDSWSPERQEVVCRNLAEVREFDVVAVFTDRGASAWNRKARRPGWEALKDAVRRGEVDVVMAYSLTRLGRRVRDLLDLSDFLRQHGCALVVADMNLDTTTPGGQLIYTVIAALAQLESEQISQRVRSAQTVMADEGRMHTGGNRQFGYDRNATVNEEEAVAVRLAADKILAGASIRSVAAELNAAGYRTTTGAEWTGSTVGRMLRSPRLAGIRRHKGRTITGRWTPILPPDKWSALLAVMDARPGRGGGINTPRHLLSSLVQCGRCGSPMVAHFSRNTEHRNVMDRYTCVKAPGLSGCGGVAASKKSVDRVVASRWADIMSSAQLRPADDEGRSLASIEADIVEADATIADLSRRQYVTRDPVLPEEVFTATIVELTERRAALRLQERTASERLAETASALRPGSREDMTAWWNAASLEDQRAALQKVIQRVVIQPARVRGGNVFQEDRVVVEASTRWYALASDQLSGVVLSDEDRADAQRINFEESE